MAAKLGAVQGSVIVVGGWREPDQGGRGLRLAPMPLVGMRQMSNA